MLQKILNVFKENIRIQKMTEEKAEKNSRRLKKPTKQNKQTENPKTCELFESSLISKQRKQVERIPRSFGSKNQLSGYKYLSH